MISELTNDERVYGSLAKEVFCVPSAEFQKALKRLFWDSSDQVQKEPLPQGIVQGFLQRASTDNSCIEKHARSLFQFCSFF